MTEIFAAEKEAIAQALQKSGAQSTQAFGAGGSLTLHFAKIEEAYALQDAINAYGKALQAKQPKGLDK